jgi:hypothetical protein
MTNARTKLALAVTLAFGVGCGHAKACGVLTFWTTECQQEKQQTSAERKFKIDSICLKMGFKPKTPRFRECYNYVNYHLNEPERLKDEAPKD